jgi:hypothetical protein
MSLIDNPNSKPSLDISPIWATVMAAEVRNLQLRQVYIEWKILCLFLLFLC